MLKVIRKLRISKRGATAIEYGLIAALVSIAAIVAFQALGDSLSTIFYGITSELDQAMSTL